MVIKGRWLKSGAIPTSSRAFRLLVALLTVTLLPLLLFTLLNYKNDRETTIAEYQDNLKAINESRVDAINHLLTLRTEQAVQLAGSVSDLGDDALSNPDKIRQVQKLINNTLAALNSGAPLMDPTQVGTSAVSNIVVRNAKTKAVASTDPSLINGNVLRADALALFAKVGYKVAGHADGYWQDSSRGADKLFFTVGLKNQQDGSFNGSVSLLVLPEILNKITANRAGLRNSGESYIVDQNNRMITSSRFITDPSEPIVVDTMGVRYSRRGQDSIDQAYLDYRGIAVYGANRYFPESKWVLLTEMDQAEILETVNQRFYSNIIITCIAALVAVILAYSLTQFITKMVRKLSYREQAAQLTKKIALLSNDDLNFNATLEAILRLICQYAKWDMGHAFFISRDSSGLLASSGLWYCQSMDEIQAFIAVTESKPLAAGCDVAGEALLANQAIFVQNVSASDKNQRSEVARQIKIMSAFAFPVICAGRTLAVLEFYTRHLEFQNTEFSELIEQVSAQVSNVMTRRENEISLRQSEASLAQSNQVKQDFLTMISHELRTPLNAIFGGLQLNDGNPSDAMAQNSTMALVQEGAEGMSDMINDILTYAEIQAKMLRPRADVCDIREEFIGLQQQYESKCLEKNLKLDWHIDKNVPQWLNIDCEKTLSIVNKLLSNAVKYTQQGVISLLLTFDNNVKKPALKIVVRDTGIGITQVNLDALSAPFTQTSSGLERRHGGLGVGLSICKELTALLSGQLNINSQPGVGTEASVSLPALSALAPAKQVKQSKSKNELPILIVEDIKVNRVILQKMLKKLGYETLVAEDGQQALLVLNQQKVCLILMDLQMPVLDGISCTKILRQQDNQTPIIAVTANLMDAQKEACIVAGMNYYLSKPVDIEKLGKTLQQFVA